MKERLFVRYSEEEEKTPGGLFIPESAKEKPQRGVVESIGSEVKDIKVNDEILFDKYSGSKITIADVEYLIIKEEDVLGIVES